MHLKRSSLDMDLPVVSHLLQELLELVAEAIA